MKTKVHYEELFQEYPDVVTLEQFRRMLGGIGDSTARKLLRSNRVKHFYIKQTYMIPKIHVIEYVMSKDYEAYRMRLSVRI